MTKLVFHLGDMKTGSTAIQSALSSRRWTCDSVKLIFPNANRVSHIAFAQSMLTPGDGPKLRKLALEIVSEVESHPEADVAVVSAEHFENVDPAVLKKAIQDYLPGYLADARFISYVRPHADRIPSTYAERIKTGMFVGTLAELHVLMHKRHPYIYTPRFQSWRNTFGDAFELRPMIREQLFRQDVVADFLQFALQTEDFTLSHAPDANESVSLENLTILRQMHVKLNGGKHKGETYQATIGRALGRRMNESNFRQGTKVSIHRELALLVRDQYAEDAAALDAAFFKGTPMSDALNAAPAKAVETEQSVRIEDHFSAREQYLINTFLDQTCVLIKANPDHMVDALRTEHRAAVIAPEESEHADAAAGARRRRAGKGRKAEAGEGRAVGRKAGAGGKLRAGRLGAGRRAAAETTAEPVAAPEADTPPAAPKATAVKVAAGTVGAAKAASGKPGLRKVGARKPSAAKPATAEE